MSVIKVSHYQIKHWLWKDVPQDHWIRGEDIYGIMLTHFESTEPDFGEYKAGMELLKKEIIEQN